MGRWGGFAARYRGAALALVLALGWARPAAASPTIPTFSTLSGSVNGLPAMMGSGDLNADGITDLVFATNASVHVMIGNANGSFQGGVLYAADSGTIAVTIGDFNNDGKLDLVTSNSTAKTYSVLLGRGDGTFPSPVNVSISTHCTSPTAIVSGDFTGDGKPDLVVGCSTSPSAALFSGAGDGSFAYHSSVALPSSPGFLAAVDVNGDAKLDVVALGGTMVTVALGQGDGTFAAPASFTGGSGLAYAVLGDVNGDGHTDMVVLDNVANAIITRLGDGTGAFGTVRQSYGASGLRQAVLADFNGDGKLDLAYQDITNSRVNIIPGNGDGTFVIGTFYAVSFATALGSGDFNRDGRPDLVTGETNGGSHILLNTTTFPPAITGISPQTGLGTGGTNVTITGTNFTGATAVNFGAMAASAFQVVSATSITATSPAGTGTVDVTVVGPGGTSSVLAADQFTYLALPTVDQVAPASGAKKGKTSVTISGSNFTGATAVNFGSTAASSFSVVSDAQITAVSPAASGPADVTVTTANGTSAVTGDDSFTFLPREIAPVYGPPSGGTKVTVKGSGFTKSSTVSFGGTAAQSVTYKSAKQLTAVSPAGAGTVKVTVTTAGVTTEVDAFSYLPVVTAVSKHAEVKGAPTSVNITGVNFGTSTTGLQVLFGSKPGTGLTLVSDKKLTVTSPSDGSGAVDVQVQTLGGTSLITKKDQFSFLPVVTGLSKKTGKAGDTVSISGKNLTGATGVSFGSTAASSFTAVSDSKVTAVVPSGSGTQQVTVTAPGGTSATGKGTGFTYTS
jgi:hypothetical protein